MKKILLLIIILTLSFNIAAQETESPSMINQVEKWYEQNMNYGSITFLMFIESTFIPLPSEIVIPPAAYIASKEGSHLNLYLVILFGTLGAYLGAIFNYFFGMLLGRPLLHKFADSKLGKLFLLSSEKIQKSEDYFKTHGKTSTFVGRLIPGIRQLISIPAGLAKMNFLTFSIFTILGAGIWNIILALVGYFAQGQSELIDKYSHEIGYIFLGIIALVAAFYLVKYLIKKAKK